MVEMMSKRIHRPAIAKTACGFMAATASKVRVRHWALCALAPNLVMCAPIPPEAAQTAIAKTPFFSALRWQACAPHERAQLSFLAPLATNRQPNLGLPRSVPEQWQKVIFNG
jgi:hypothetical protein